MSIEQIRQQDAQLIEVIKQAAAALDAVGGEAVNAALRAFEESRRNALARLKSQADAVRASLSQLAGDAADVAKQLHADVFCKPAEQPATPAEKKAETTATPK